MTEILKNVSVSVMQELSEYQSRNTQSVALDGL